MPSRFWFKLAAIATAVALIFAAVHAWRVDRRDRAQLAAELASTKQLVAAADARQRDRDAQLAQTLADLAAQKRAVVSPAQIVRELPKTISLPEPIALQDASLDGGDRRGTIYRAPAGAAIAPRPGSAPHAMNDNSPATPSAAQTSLKPQAPTQAVIPKADLKPLYDFAIDCQACQAKLAAAQSDLADEKAKTAALAKERDDAVRLAKGGSAWRRARRAAKWFLLGAAAGAAVAKAR